MVTRNFIICRHCGKNTGYAYEDFMFMVLTHDVLCPHCGKVVIAVVQHRPMWTVNGEAPQYSTTYTCTGH